MKYFPDFQWAINAAKEKLKYSDVVSTGHWQGVNIKQKPEYRTYEILNFSFQVLLTLPDLDYWRTNIQPSLPWADDHFEERVCGQPINPGKEWKNWPYAHSAAGHLDNGGKFNHNYSERYWPKHAGLVNQPTSLDNMYYDALREETDYQPGANTGIYHEYGDLNDVVNLLVREPTTRQAYLPIFFPEDTGAVHRGRLPCSLGYHFIQRDGLCHIVYYLRSCDFVRHFRDDIYLTLRLLLWVIQQCAKQDKAWNNVKPGTFSMHITSLHMFVNDYHRMFKPEGITA